MIEILFKQKYCANKILKCKFSSKTIKYINFPTCHYVFKLSLAQNNYALNESANKTRT